MTTRIIEKAPRVALVLTAILFLNSCTSEGAWDLFGLLNEVKRVKLTFQNAGQAENLDDFPVLVVLKPSRVDYRRILPDGSNVRFFDSDGSTQLSSEVEKLQRDGQSYIWVKVPRIEGASDSDCIWMDYGGCFGSQPVVGYVGGARYFDGIDDFIDCGNDSSLEILGQVTVSAWIKPAADIDTVMRILSKKQAWDAPAGYDLAINPLDDEIHHLRQAPTFFAVP